jgi:hypothetical protein
MAERVVWKFPIPFDWLTVTGGDPRVVLVAVDPASPEYNMPTVWVELEPGGVGSLALTFIGTGHDVPEGASHVGSCITPVGLVWHVYKRNE